MANFPWDDHMAWSSQVWGLWTLSNVGDSASMRSCLVSWGKWLSTHLTYGQIQSLKFISWLPSSAQPPEKMVLTGSSTNVKSARNLTYFWHYLNHVDFAPPGWRRSSLEVKMVLCVLCHLSLWGILVISATQMKFISQVFMFTPFVQSKCVCVSNRQHLWQN